MKDKLNKPDLADVAALVLDRLELDAGDRGESVYLPAALRAELRAAIDGHKKNRPQR